MKRLEPLALAAGLLAMLAAATGVACELANNTPDAKRLYLCAVTFLLAGYAASRLEPRDQP